MSLIMKKNLFRPILINAIIIISLAIFLSGCVKHEKIKIALSKGAGSEHYEGYSKWLTALNPDVECIDLYFIDKDKAVEALQGCSALVLTGGPDVNPGYYGKPSDSSRCEIDPKRDTLEFLLIKKAAELGLPVLCICRGEQIMNVAMGGSLIVDIPTDFDTTICHRCDDKTKCFHDIEIETSSHLYQIVGTDKALVNSSHHQAVDRLADCFVPTAHSPDGLIEAYQWRTPKDKPFLVAVQWHPERLDTASPMSGRFGRYFIEQAKQFKNKNLP